MSKVTGKLQVTLPKALAERYGIAPGDDIRVAAAKSIDLISKVYENRFCDRP